MKTVRRAGTVGLALSAAAVGAVLWSAWPTPAGSEASHAPSALSRPDDAALRPYPVAWQRTVVARRYVADRYGPTALRYGTPLSHVTLTAFGEKVRSLACAYSHCWAIGVTTQGLQYPLTRTVHSRTWRIGGPWFSGAYADAVASAARIQILSANAVIAFTSGNWAYLSTDRGESWQVVGLGHVVRAELARRGSHTPTYAVEAETESTPIQARTYVSTNGIVWRLTPTGRHVPTP